MNRIFICLSGLLFFMSGSFTFAQENLEYQKPPQEILELIDVPLAPSTIINSDGDMMVFLYRDQFKSIAELSEQELRLGGLRINPVTNISSRARYFNNIQVKPTDKQEPTQIKGLPENPRLTNLKSLLLIPQKKA